MRNRMIPAACAAATLALGFSTPTAFAGDNLEVTFNRDALQSTRGSQSELTDIERQIKSYCLYRSGPQTLKEARAARDCVSEMMTKTIAQIDDRRLSALFKESRLHARLYRDRLPTAAW